MKKRISYSLWGDDQAAFGALIANIEQIRVQLPDWSVIVYANGDVPEPQIDVLTRCENVEVLQPAGSPFAGFQNEVLKFYAAAFDDSERVLFQDCSPMDIPALKTMLKEWENSGKDYLFLNTLKKRTGEAYGGMWGVKGGLLKDINDLLEKWLLKSLPNVPGVSDVFVRDFILPRSHSSYVRYQIPIN